MPLAPAYRLGPYDVLALISSGTMGEVYRARDGRLGREVAITILPPAFAADPERLDRFQHKVRAAGVLNHPNIVSVYDVGTQDEVHFVVTELVEGDTLRAKLGAGPLPVRVAVEYGAQIARGLAAAHEKGVIHRDLRA
jgi:serine/threonine protein kinase